MTTYLRIEGEVWRIPANANAREIHQRIVQAMQRGEVVQVPVELGDDPRGQTSLTINGRAASQFALVEVPDQGQVT
jgi:hypothetical protein